MNIERKRNGAGVDGGEPVIKKANFSNPLMSIQYITFCKVCTLEKILCQQVFEWLDSAESYQVFQHDGFGLLQLWLNGQNIQKITLGTLDDYRDKSDCTPLHQALETNRSYRFITKMLQIVPDLVKVKCNGSLPLHTALANGVSFELIVDLYDKYPESVMTTDGNDELPLQVAVSHNAEFQIVYFILMEYPEAATRCTSLREYPIIYRLIYHMVDPTIIKSILAAHPDAASVSKFSAKPLHIAVNMEYKYRERFGGNDLVEVVLEAYPDSVKIPDKYGRLPLQLALLNHVKSKVVQKIFDKYPEAASVEDHKGTLPLHTAISKRATCSIIKKICNAYQEGAKMKRRFNDLPLHSALFLNLDEGIIKTLLEAYPEAVRVEMNFEFYPLHYAFRQYSPKVARIIYELYPEAVNFGNCAGLTPFDLALDRSDCQEFILELLVMFPNAIGVEQLYIFLEKYPNTIEQVLM